MRSTFKHLLLVLAVFAYTLVPVRASAVEIPSPTSTAFQQTTGRDAGLNIGDWYTNVAGGNTIHHIDVEVGCNWPQTTPITIAVFDPELNVGYGTAAPYAIDEIRGTADTTRFQLRSPSGGALVPWRSFTPTNGSDGRWVEILTFRPADLPAADRCGTFVLESEVSDGNPVTPEDDDNSWRLRANHDPDCGLTPGTCSTVGAASSTLMSDGDEISNPDGLAGTGDELAIGYTRASQQHGGAGTTCQDYWFFDDGSSGPTFSVRNFDMDGSGSITYYPPSGSPASIAGTVSANASWASNTLNSDIGWWRTAVCINATNQYIFDGIAGRTVYFATPPAEPQMSITKDDGRATAVGGDTLTWTLAFQNDSVQGSGGAPAFNVEITDTLPSGTTFSSCTIDAPVTGSCSESGGVVTFSIDQSINAQGGTAPTGGTATVSATVDDLAAGTLTNSAVITYTDPFVIPMIPATATDDTTVDPSIGDFVWNDLNGNGSQDPSEPGIDGVAVTLWDAGQITVLGSTITSGGGRYTFTGVSAGDYVVEFAQPAGLIPTRANVGADGTDSDPDRSTLTAAVTLGAASGDASIDAGFVAPADIGDLVWQDENGNGSLDGAEGGLAGVDVRLYSPGVDATLGTGDDVLEATTTTSGTGAYSFIDLLAGDYRVDIDESTLPAGVDFETTANEPLDHSLAAGESYGAGDFGYRRSAVIAIQTLTNGQDADTGPGPYVPVGSAVTWTYEVTNPGILALTSILVSDDGGAGPVYQSGDTNSNNELDPGETWLYQASGIANAGAFSHTGSAVGSQTSGPDVSANDPTNHYGASGSIGDRVWDDANSNGIQDGAEPNLGSVTVELYRASDLVTPIATTTTNPSGIYGFSNLIPDDYVVTFLPPSGYGFSPIGQGTPATDSNADPSTGLAAVTVGLDESTIDVDAGMFRQATIGDFVYEDTDANGTYDGTDGALPGVTVELLDATGTTVLDTTTTNGSGIYGFTTNPGDYIVRFTALPGMTFSTPATIAITAASGDTIDTADAGLYTPATIGDFVFEDQNGNGVFDGSDSALSGVTVELLDATGTTVLDTTTTNGSGIYGFTTNPGDYIVRFTALPGMTFSTPATIAITAASGDTIDTADAGMFGVPEIEIVKSGPATATVGEDVTYTYALSHGPASSGSDITTISVTDIDADVATITLISGDINGNNILESTETWIYEATRTIAADDPDPLDSLATAIGADLTGSPVTDSDGHPVDITRNPVIDIQKTGPATAAVGDSVTYTYTVTHDATSDNTDITTVTVTDTDAAVTGITLISGDTNTDSILQATETWVYEGTRIITASDPDPLDTTATVNGLDLDTDPVTDTNNHPVDITRNPVIDIQKTGPATAAVGDSVTYTYTVTHDATSDNTDITTVTVTDTDAAVTGITLISGDTNTDSILQATETWVYEGTRIITASDPDPLDTTATVNGLDLDTDPVTDTNNHPVDITRNPVIDIQKTGPATAAVGDSVTYTYTVTHDATSDNTDITTVTVTDTDAAVTGITLISGDTNTDSILQATETWVYEGTRIITASDPDPLDTTATVNGLDLDTDPVTDTNNHPVDITRNPVIDIQKTGPATAAVGDSVTYTYTVTHDATSDNTDITTVTVTDTDAAVTGITLISGDTNTDSILQATETWVYEGTRIITASDPDPLDTTATVNGLDLDTDPVTDTNNHPVDITRNPVIDIQKTGPATAAVGDSVTYTYTVTHDATSDNTDITTVTVTDTDAAVTGITLISGDTNTDSILQATETWVYEGTRIITASDPDPLDTTATVNGLDLDTDPVTDTNNHPVDITRNPVIDIQKTGPATANVGDTVTYSFAVTNDASGDGTPISNVTVTDDIAGTATYLFGDLNSNALLETGETWQYSVNYTIGAADPTSLINTVSVDGEDADGDPVGPATDNHITTIAHSPVIDIQKTGPATANVGDSITYTYTVTHDALSDESDITTVSVIDADAGVTGIALISGDTNNDGILQAAETWTYTGTRTITASDPDILDTLATVNGLDLDGDTATDTNNHPVAIEFAPTLAVVKSGPATANVGDTVTYSFAVTNDATGDGSPIKNVTGTDDIAGAATYQSGDTNTNTLLETGETWTYEATYTIQTTDPTTLTNTVSVSGEDPDGDPVGPVTDNHDTTVTYNPVIDIQKTGPATANVGDTITYTYTVTHDATSDNTDITTVSVTDADAGVTGIAYVSGDTNNDGILQSTETWIYQGNRTITASDPDPLNSTATVNGQSLTPTPVTDNDDHPVDVVFDPAIDIVKSGPLSANVGATVLFNYEVTNDTVAGDGSPINTVTVTDSIAGAATYLGGDTNGNGLLEPGETWLFEATYTVLPTDPDPLVSPVDVDGFSADSAPVTDADTHSMDIGFGPVMVVVKSGPSTAATGDNVTYTFDVINDGVAGDGSAISLLTADDDVAGSATYVSGDANTNGLLEIGETWQFSVTYTIQGSDSDPLVNTATAAGVDIDGDPVTTGDSHSTAIDYQPEILIVKAGPATAAIGDTITYTYEVTNDTIAGDGSPINTVTVTDSIAGPATYLSGDTNNDGILQVGETWLYEAPYTVLATDPDPLLSPVTVDGLDQDAEPVTDADTHSLNIDHAPVIDIQKTGPATASPGDTITYSYTVTHDPSSDGSDIATVVVTDDDGDVTAPTLVSGDTNNDLILQSTETWTYQASYIVTADDPDPINTIATVDGVDVDGDAVTDTDSHPVTVDYQPEILIVKAGPATAATGDTITYTYEVTNDTIAGDGSPINTVTVTDSIAGPATYLSGDTNNDGILQVGETWLYEAPYTVLATDPDPLLSPVMVDGLDQDAEPVTDADTHSLNIDYNPVIDIVKNGPLGANVGDSITFTYDVTNDDLAGDGSPISGVTVTDSIAGAAAYVSGDTNGDSILQVGETWVFDAPYTILPTDPDPLNSSATTDGFDLDLDPVSDTDTHSIDLGYFPAIDIVTTGPAVAAVGDTITYTYTVTNDTVAGDGTNIASVTVTDDIAGAGIYVSGDTNTDGILQVGEVWIFEAAYTVLASDPDPLVNNGTADGVDVEGDPVTDVDPHSADVDFGPLVEIVKSGPASASVGDTITYTYTVTHDPAGDGSELSAVTVSDSDPDVVGIAVVSGDTNNDSILQDGETWIFEATYTVAVDDPDPIDTPATVDATDRDGAPVSGTDTHPVDIAFAPVIEIVKSGPAMAAIGETITYTYTVTHNPAGDGSDISGLAVADVDTDVTGLTLTSGDTNSDGILQDGETWIFEGTRVITATDPDPLNTAATATGSDRDGDTVSDTDNHPVDLAQPAIGAADSISGPVVNNGDGTYTLTYQIEVVNTGDVALAGLLLDQNLGSTFVGVDAWTVDSVSSPDLSVDPSFNGSTNTNLIDGSDTLVPSETASVFVTVTVTPGTALGPHLDQVLAAGTPPVGTDVTDLSDSGSNPDPSDTNPGAPGDSGGSDDPTPVSFGENPVIGLAEQITSSVDNGDGTYTVTYLLTVENLGDVDLSATQVSNDLATTFATADGFVVTGTQSPDFTIDPTYDGDAQQNLLDASDLLAVGGTGTIQIDVVVTPGTNAGPYDNNATAFGTSPSGIGVSDISQVGTDVDPDNDGNPANNSAPTTISFGQSTVTGQIWLDLDADGVIDPGEEGISGARVVLVCPGPDGIIGTGDDMPMQEATSSPYSISGFFSGDCSVTVDTSTLSSEVAATFDPDGGEDSTSMVTVTPGTTSVVNFGYVGGYDFELFKWLASGPIDNAVTWGLAVTNIGTAASPAFEVTDALPDALSLTSASGPGLTCTNAGNVATCTHPGLSAGESVTLQIETVIVNSDFSVIENTASVQSLGLTAEPVTINNAGAANLNLAALPATGAATDVVLPIAVVLLLSGGAIVFFARRRDEDDEVVA